MSGLEVAVGVVSIVSAIVKVAEAIRTFRNNRNKKKARIQRGAEDAEFRLLSTLDNSPPQINDEYSRDLVRIGPTFSRGDRIFPLFRFILS